MPLNRAICLLARDIQNVADRILRSYDVTSEQLYVMQCLAEGDTWYPQREICRRTKKKPANVTRIVDRLESKPLVSRKTSPLDRRVYIVMWRESP
ncbi:MAG: MarR family transcriptional regulator [Desulfuromonadaceae bacterium]|nr:MarR family transcriptional regulator [Desulfuromonadaceae bacterium]